MDLNIDALETSFDHIASRGDELVDAFYGRLFAVAPGVGAALRRHRSQTAEGHAALPACSCAPVHAVVGGSNEAPRTT